GKFWEMHDAIFANQKEMAPEKYLGYATQLGLDLERFKKDLEAPEVKKRVDADVEEAARLNVRGTPGFFVNGRYLSGAQPFEAFKHRIEEELAAKNATKG
ncbi:MAG: DsbA family protein, partial [Vicinamibacteria bacterium]